VGGERLHILVLDDDPVITELIADVLGAECSVTVANTIDEASAALELGDYDLLLCDLMIDSVVSTAFLETVAARRPALRRVLISGSPNHEWQGMLERGVVVAALSKPFESNELWAVIRSNE
jgi:two-component system, cell cycle response regulator CpdR